MLAVHHDAIGLVPLLPSLPLPIPLSAPSHPTLSVIPLPGAVELLRAGCPCGCGPAAAGPAGGRGCGFGQLRRMTAGWRLRARMRAGFRCGPGSGPARLHADRCFRLGPPAAGQSYAEDSAAQTADGPTRTRSPLERVEPAGRRQRSGQGLRGRRRGAGGAGRARPGRGGAA